MNILSQVFNHNKTVLIFQFIQSCCYKTCLRWSTTSISGPPLIAVSSFNLPRRPKRESHDDSENTFGSRMSLYLNVYVYLTCWQGEISWFHNRSNDMKLKCPILKFVSNNWFANPKILMESRWKPSLNDLSSFGRQMRVSRFSPLLCRG